MQKLVLLLVLIALFSYSIAVPLSCSGGSNGNGVLELDAETEEAQTERFWNRPARPVFGGPRRPVFGAPRGFVRNPFHVNLRPEASFKNFAANLRTNLGRAGANLRNNFRRFGRQVTQNLRGSLANLNKQGSIAAENLKKALKKLLGREPTQKDIDDYTNGNDATDKAADDALAKANGGAKGTGKFTFVELSPTQTDKCLGTYFFCNVDCATDFGLKCTVNAKIYSVFVTRRQHVNLCVIPRASNPIPEMAKKPEYQEECMLRPCGCSVYQKWFNGQYGAKEFNNGMKQIQEQCSKWCKSGVKPAGVMDADTANRAIKKNKASLLRGMGKFFGGIGKFFVGFGKAIGKTFVAIGKGIGKVAGKVGRALGKAARKIGGAFRRIGGGIRRFFRRW
jgi:hypothetical protein